MNTITQSKLGPAGYGSAGTVHVSAPKALRLLLPSAIFAILSWVQLTQAATHNQSLHFTEYSDTDLRVSVNGALEQPVHLFPGPHTTDTWFYPLGFQVSSLSGAGEWFEPGNQARINYVIGGSIQGLGLGITIGSDVLSPFFQGVTPVEDGQTLQSAVNWSTRGPNGLNSSGGFDITFTDKGDSLIARTVPERSSTFLLLGAVLAPILRLSRARAVRT